jgi:hypothetical protein
MLGSESARGRLVNVTASSVLREYPAFQPQNVVEWGRSKGWISKAGDIIGEWIDFDLRGIPFLLDGIAIYTFYRYFAKRWELLGSNGDEDWRRIYESNDDARLDPADEWKKVFLPIQNSSPFSRYRILAKSLTFWNEPRWAFGFNAIEFFGSCSA